MNKARRYKVHLSITSVLVFASSIAVIGPPLPDVINDDTIPVAVMHDGGQKRMVEVAIEQLSAHGWIDGLAIRLPGIVARRGAVTARGTWSATRLHSTGSASEHVAASGGTSRALPQERFSIFGGSPIRASKHSSLDSRRSQPRSVTHLAFAMMARSLS